MKPLRLREGTKRVEDGSRDETVTESGRHERWWGPGRVCLSVRKAGRRPEESSSESTFYLIAKERALRLPRFEKARDGEIWRRERFEKSTVYFAFLELNYWDLLTV